MRLQSRLLAYSLAGCCLLATHSTSTLAQDAKPAKPAVGTLMSPSATYDKLLTTMESQFVSAAEALPEEKYNFAPPMTAGEFKGVRTFAGQVKHVADANYEFFGGSDFTEAQSKARSEAIDKLSSKAEILQALKVSFAQAHKYIAGITPENAFVMTEHGTRASMATFGIAHLMDHYGQMVVYLRMNGIVPPASRGGM
jgi:uncharacterized damage-inducible protein DinB